MYESVLCSSFQLQQQLLHPAELGKKKKKSECVSSFAFDGDWISLFLFLQPVLYMKNTDRIKSRKTEEEEEEGAYFLPLMIRFRGGEGEEGAY